MTPKQAREVSGRIASGNAYFKHVIGGKEFPVELSRGEFARLIETAILKPTKTKAIRSGRIAYWYGPENLLVIFDPRHKDLGTAFVPSQGLPAFRELR